jgi:putative Mg2+ transporter-C (MgtC) family protein
MAGIQFLSSTDAESRIFQALITGMGFIGGGAILKVQDKGMVSGTATAASLWVTGAIGMCVATNFLELAIILSLLTFVTLRVLRMVKHAAENQLKN